MTTEVSANRNVTGRKPGTFGPGNNANPNGRPKKGNAIRDLLKRVPLAQKRALIEVAFEMAIQERDVHWAEWIAKHSGESGSTEKGDLTVNIDNRRLVVHQNGAQE